MPAAAARGATHSRQSSQASTSSSRRSSDASRRRAYSTRSKNSSQGSISIRSFSDFRAQIPVPSPISIKRKPLPASASPQLSCFSPTSTVFSIDDLLTASLGREEAPTVARTSTTRRPDSTIPAPLHVTAQGRAARDRAASSASSAGRNNTSSAVHRKPLARSTTTALSQPSARTTKPSRRLPSDSHIRYYDAIHTEEPETLPSTVYSNGSRATSSRQAAPVTFRRTSAISHTSLDPPFLDPHDVPFLGRPDAHDMSVFPDTLPRATSGHSIGTVGSGQTVSPSKKRNSPGSKFSSFFGWNNKSSPPRQGPDSPLTPFTDRYASPLVSPSNIKHAGLDRSVSAPRIGVPAQLDIHAANGGYQQTGLPTPFTASTATIAAHIEELEKELREVSTELACSIRREMDLEDENDRLKGDPTVQHALTRRTSDYFSDSGSSAPKTSVPDFDKRIEELERAKRRIEQEKGQVQADYSVKLAEEMRRRHDLEMHVASLEVDAQDNNARALAGSETNERIRELETFLDETRRRLSQERQSRDNIEDLLAALRSELTQIRNERDNLVEEIVPQLKARIEGLEQENAEASTLRYENARMQQELGNPVTSRSRVNSIAEGGDSIATTWKMGGLARSNSLFGNNNSSLKRSGSTLQRSGSVRGHGHEAAVLNEVEAQRDALHNSLKNLIRRHEAERREHARAIQRLIVDREQEFRGPPGRAGFAKHVAALKSEIVTLRKRADDALAQKWQYEDNLGGVKMALDRAEAETRALRATIASSDRSGSSDGLGISISENGRSSPASMLALLRRSIQVAETERDAAMREAAEYRATARSASRSTEAKNDLLLSADNLEDLASQLDACVSTNVALRERLVAALTASESTHAAATVKVTRIQTRLRGLEDALLSAREESETAFAADEDIVRDTDPVDTPHVTRLRLDIPGPKHTGHRAGEGIFSARTPKLGGGKTLGEGVKREVLEGRIVDLETALGEAEGDLRGVVGEVEKGRGEVAALQGERDSASVGMKKLQARIGEERQRALRLVTAL